MNMEGGTPPIEFEELLRCELSELGVATHPVSSTFELNVTENRSF